MRVVLPAPFGPRIPKTSLFAIDRVTWSSATRFLGVLPRRTETKFLGWEML